MKPFFYVMPDQMRKKVGIIMYYFEYRLSNIQAKNLRITQDDSRRIEQIHHVNLNRYFGKKALSWKFFGLLLSQVLGCNAGGL
jgi:hypothetical protein